MPRLTVMKNDKLISVDDQPEWVDDLSELDDDIHSIHWDGNEGVITYKNEPGIELRGGVVKPPKRIHSINQYHALFGKHADKKEKRHKDDAEQVQKTLDKLPPEVQQRMIETLPPELKHRVKVKGPK
jgi:hypothetical protein